MTGLAWSSCNLLSISHTSRLRFSWSASMDCSNIFLQLGTAIPGVVTLRAAGVVLIELCIRVISSDPSEIEADRVIFAIDFGKPVGGLDRVEFAIDVDLFELVDQDDRPDLGRWQCFAPTP